MYQLLHFVKCGGCFFFSETLGKINRMSLVYEVILWAGPVNYAAGKGWDMLMMKIIVQKDTRKT